MKRKIGIILICLTFIFTGFSGCTEFDGEDGFFDWLLEDGPPQGGYDYCWVYTYITITVLNPYGFDEIPGLPDANGSQFHFVIGQQF